MYIAYTYPYNQSYHTYAYIHLYICTYVPLNRYTYTHICANVHICIYTNMHIYAACMHTYMSQLCSNLYTQVYMRVCMLVYVYVYVYMCIDTKSFNIRGRSRLRTSRYSQICRLSRSGSPAGPWLSLRRHETEQRLPHRPILEALSISRIGRWGLSLLLLLLPFIAAVVGVILAAVIRQPLAF